MTHYNFFIFRPPLKTKKKSSNSWRKIIVINTENVYMHNPVRILLCVQTTSLKTDLTFHCLVIDGDDDYNNTEGVPYLSVQIGFISPKHDNIETRSRARATF